MSEDEVEPYVFLARFIMAGVDAEAKLSTMGAEYASLLEDVCGAVDHVLKVCAGVSK